MYYHVLGGITTEANFQIIILFLVSAQYISSSLKKIINLQRIILTHR